MSVALLNGEPATADDLRVLALGNFGHYTSLQVRARAARGLDLHLQRLQSATRELFAVELDASRIRDDMLAALDAARADDAGMRITVFSRAFDHLAPHPVGQVDVLVTAGAARAVSADPLRLKSYVFERALPHLKHTGIFAQIQLRTRAMRAGFDDALFVDAGGQVSEGTVWNIVFVDGDDLVWPVAPALRGITGHLLREGLDALGIAQRDRPVELRMTGGFRAAFAVNATGLRPIAGIDDVRFAPAPEIADLLARALSHAPWQPL